MEQIFFGLNAVSISAILLSIVFTAGVVWRVEKKLDISYKFFLAAIVFIFFAEILDLYYAIDNAQGIALAVKILRMLFSISFLVGVIFMRNIIRQMDGELKKK